MLNFFRNRNKNNKDKEFEEKLREGEPIPKIRRVQIPQKNREAAETETEEALPKVKTEPAYTGRSIRRLEFVTDEADGEAGDSEVETAADDERNTGETDTTETGADEAAEPEATPFEETLSSIEKILAHTGYYEQTVASEMEKRDRRETEVADEATDETPAETEKTPDQERVEDDRQLPFAAELDPDTVPEHGREESSDSDNADSVDSEYEPADVVLTPQGELLVRKPDGDTIDNPEEAAVISESTSGEEVTDAVPMADTPRPEPVKTRPVFIFEMPKPVLKSPDPPTMDHMVKESRYQLPLPKEMQAENKQVHLAWFKTEFDRCRTKEEIEDFAHRLTTNDLSLIFPILSTVKNFRDRDRLYGIIEARAGRYLYSHGWTTMQYTYPNSYVQRGLSLLCKTMEDNALPFHNVNRMKEAELFSSQDLPQDHFNWATIPLISAVSMPNNRHFVSDLVSYAVNHDYSPDRLFQMFGIYTDTPFAEAVLQRFIEFEIEGTGEGSRGLRRFFEV